MKRKVSQDSFNFFVPVTFEKAKRNNKEVVKIKGIASSSSAMDSDKETLFPIGFDYTPFLEKGFFNWDHQTKSRPTSIIGEPTSAKVINGGRDFYVEGFLYPDSKEAQEVAELAKVLESNSSTRKLGYSIEGQVIKRDPFDEKKVLKARITGIAITPSPKNPNTLMSLMKGEYDDLFVDEEEEEDDLDKAMDVASNGHVVAESVEGFKKKKNVVIEGAEGNGVGKLVRKSEIYNLIASRYTTDVVKAKQIFSLIESVNLKMHNMTDISMDAVNKAFDLLEKANSVEAIEGAGKLEDSFEKSDDNDDDDFSGKKEKEDSDGDDKEDGKDEDDVDDKMEKAKGMAKDCLAKGMSADEATETLIKGGFSLSVSQTAVASVVSAASNLKENGGDVEKVSAPSVTGDDQPLKKGELSDMLGDAFGSTNDLIKGMQDEFGGKFTAIGKILKHSVEQNEILKGEIDTLNGRLKKVESEGIPSKSLRNVSAIERFAKSEEDEIGGGSDVFSMSKAEDRKDLLDRLDAEIEKSRANGRTPSAVLIDTISEIEICKSVPQRALATLKALNIKVTK